MTRRNMTNRELSIILTIIGFGLTVVFSDLVLFNWTGTNLSDYWYTGVIVLVVFAVLLGLFYHAERTVDKETKGEE